MCTSERECGGVCAFFANNFFCLCVYILKEMFVCVTEFPLPLWNEGDYYLGVCVRVFAVMLICWNVVVLTVAHLTQ